MTDIYIKHFQCYAILPFDGENFDGLKTKILEIFVQICFWTTCILYSVTLLTDQSGEVSISLFICKS